MLDTAAPPTAARVLAPARRPEVLLGAVLTILYGVLLLLDLSVPQPTDHSHYMHAARTFPSKPTSPLIYHQYLRIGLTGCAGRLSSCAHRCSRRRCGGALRKGRHRDQNREHNCE